ncbi:hypothetical protein AA313_de0203798 [Arthrobotrys entomopaga]|nr:hypothetical protein AA313_de0203798 [Arthrobotrys entomopaga]
MSEISKDQSKHLVGKSIPTSTFTIEPEPPVTTPCHLAILPPELHLHILSLLSPVDQIRVSIAYPLYRHILSSTPLFLRSRYPLFSFKHPTKANYDGFHLFFQFWNIYTTLNLEKQCIDRIYLQMRSSQYIFQGYSYRYPWNLSDMRGFKTLMDGGYYFTDKVDITECIFLQDPVFSPFGILVDPDKKVQSIYGFEQTRKDKETMMRQCMKRMKLGVRVRTGFNVIWVVRDVEVQDGGGMSVMDLLEKGVKAVFESGAVEREGEGVKVRWEVEYNIDACGAGWGFRATVVPPGL